jgi:hypothetical protein
MYATPQYQIAKVRVAELTQEAHRHGQSRAARHARNQQAKRSTPRITAVAARRLLTALGAHA